MRRLTQNQLAMVETTVAFLLQNEAVWNSNPALVKAVTDVRKQLSAIRATTSKYPAAMSSAAERAQTRELLEDLASEIADQLYALSQETNDVALAAATDFTRASLDRMTDQQLEHTAKHVCELATAHRDALTGYLVVAADVAQLATLTRNFSTWPTQSKAAAGRFAAANLTLEERVRTACRLLRGRIDKLVPRYWKTVPEFVRGYHAARVVIDRHGQRDTSAPIAPEDMVNARRELACS